MEKNSLLLLSEVIFQINSCQTMQELERNLFYHLNLFVPFRYASYIEVQEDPRTGELDYSIRFCKPQSFVQVEKSWLATLDQATTLWLSSSPEPVVIRDSELFNGDHRADVPSYQLPGYQRLQIFDALQLNVVDGGRTVGRLSLYRAQADGLFTDQDSFKLRLLSKHISLAFARCARRHLRRPEYLQKHPVQAQQQHLSKMRRQVPLGAAQASAMTQGGGPHGKKRRPAPQRGDLSDPRL